MIGKPKNRGFVHVPALLTRILFLIMWKCMLVQLFIASFLNMCHYCAQREYYERELEKRSIKTNPLGKDRHHNRYWWFRRDGRIFVESSDSKEWGYYSSMEEVSQLCTVPSCSNTSGCPMTSLFDALFYT